MRCTGKSEGSSFFAIPGSIPLRSGEKMQKSSSTGFSQEMFPRSKPGGAVTSLPATMTGEWLPMDCCFDCPKIVFGTHRRMAIFFPGIRPIPTIWTLKSSTRKYGSARFRVRGRWSFFQIWSRGRCRVRGIILIGRKWWWPVRKSSSVGVVSPMSWVGKFISDLRMTLKNLVIWFLNQENPWGWSWPPHQDSVPVESKQVCFLLEQILIIPQLRSRLVWGAILILTKTNSLAAKLWSRQIQKTEAGDCG